MLNQDYIAKLLDLEDVKVTKVKNVSDELHVHMELPPGKHICPACGAATNCAHDYRIQTIPLGRKTSLHLRKRRYRCVCGIHKNE